MHLESALTSPEFEFEIWPARNHQPSSLHSGVILHSSATMSLLVIDTVLGTINLQFLPESAPRTVSQISNIINSKLYDNTKFYRSDFVIQFGLHGSGRSNPHGDLAVNETGCAGTVTSNTRGTASVAHFDVPDCGGSEVFINLGDNAHLDSAYGGYCVFARVDPHDEASFRVIDAIAAEVKTKGSAGIRSVRIQ